MSGEWRVDPTGRHEYRWWDGDRFTEFAATDGEQVVDPVAAVDAPTAVDVGFGPSGPQNRWTVAFRIVLAIPHLLWITLVTIGALFVLVAGWFAALFTGRLPDGIGRFLFQVLRYHVRLLAYLFLLRDDYPPFALGDASYPVSATTQAGPLNRVAVLFRIVLIIPVMLVSQWLTAGATIVLVVLWVVVLVTGRMPGVAALALGAIVRFEARTYGYGMLLAAAYPTGLFGDRDPQGRSRSDATELPDTPPAATRLYLPTGARVLVVVCLVLGLVQSFVNGDGTGFQFTSGAAGARQPVQVERSCSSSCSSTAPDLS